LLLPALAIGLLLFVFAEVVLIGTMSVIRVVSPNHVGNVETQTRIIDFLRQSGFSVLPALPSDLVDVPDDVLHSNTFWVLIHAYRSVEKLDATKFPSRYILVLGGTDVNELSREVDKLAVMNCTVRNAACIVCFSESLADGAALVWPHCADKLTVIRQSVALPKHIPCATTGVPPDTKVVLLIAGLRPVKDPLFVVPRFVAWANEQAREQVVLMLIGPTMDDTLKNEVMSWTSSGHVVWIPGVPRCEVLGLMSSDQTVLVINTSRSEGQPQAILEAMKLRKPVCVRRIPANIDLVGSCGERGEIFGTPDEFIACMERVLQRTSDIQEKVTRAASFVDEFHAEAREAAAYSALIRLHSHS
jgi:hypothetical protein